MHTVRHASLSERPSLELVRVVAETRAFVATQFREGAEANMSAAVFSRWFKGRVGCTFQRYVNELRVARVCARLLNGAESITEVAFGCGYNSLANFNRRFRELTGLTPKEFRSQTRQMQEGCLHRFLIRLGRHGAVRVVPDGRDRSAAPGNSGSTKARNRCA